MEVKTRRVCLSDGKDVLDMDGPVSFLYGYRGYNEDALNNLTPREKKETTILYQVCWFSREIFVSLIILKSPDMASITHSMLRTFNCCQRRTLFLGHPERRYTQHTKKYHFSDTSASLSDLSFFIAHSLYARHAFPSSSSTWAYLKLVGVGLLGGGISSVEKGTQSGCKSVVANARR